jgi:periplasmic divalent cation tolerance protein
MTTLDDEQKARHLARSLVEQHLAACVQVLPPMHACYRWQGQVEEASEHLIQIKTAPARADEVMRWLAGHHPYALAEIVRLDASASEAYAEWVAGSVSGPKT